MPVTDVTHDLATLTLTITAQFAAPVERIWQIYADPRQLEQVWGPPTYPATVVDHDLTPGGRVTYFMTSPAGEKFAGYWQITHVEEPHRLTFEDGFADADFVPDPDLPVSTNDYRFQPYEGGTRAVYLATYRTAADLQKVLEMGIVEGASAALDQIDDLIGAAAAS